jgi:hypothetical protein
MWNFAVSHFSAQFIQRTFGLLDGFDRLIMFVTQRPCCATAFSAARSRP